VSDMQKMLAMPEPVDEPAIMAEVESWVNADEDARPARREGWRIESLQQADWVMRKLAEVQTLGLEYQATIEAWKHAYNRIADAGQWFEDRLAEWAILNRTSTVKSFATPHGTVKTRSNPARVVIVDEDAAVEWARAHMPAAVRTSYKLLVSELSDEDAHIGALVTAWVSIHKVTGEQETLPITPVVFTPELLADLQEAIGDEHVVEAVTEPAVVGRDGKVIPGLDVRPSTVTASIATFRP